MLMKRSYITLFDIVVVTAMIVKSFVFKFQLITNKFYKFVQLKKGHNLTKKIIGFGFRFFLNILFS